MVSDSDRLREAKKQIGIVLEKQGNQDEQLQEIYDRLDEILPNDE